MSSIISRLSSGPDNYAISDISFSLAVRRAPKPENKPYVGTMGIYSDKEFECVNNPGGGHCASYSVSHSLGRGYQEFDWVFLDDLGVGSLIYGRASDVVIFNQEDKTVYYFKHPLISNGPKLMVLRRGDHYMAIKEVKDIRNYKMKVNFPVTLKDIHGILPGKSISPLSVLFTDPLSAGYDKPDLLEMILRKIVFRPLNNEEETFLLENGGEYMRRALEVYRANPEVHVKESLKRLTGGYVAHDLTSAFSYKLISSPVIKMNISKKNPTTGSQLDFEAHKEWVLLTHPDRSKEKFDYEGMTYGLLRENIQDLELDFDIDDVSPSMLSAPTILESSGLTCDESRLVGEIAKMEPIACSTITSWPAPSNIVDEARTFDPVNHIAKLSRKSNIDMSDVIKDLTDLDMILGDIKYKLIRCNKEEEELMDKEHNVNLNLQLASSILRLRGIVFENLIRLCKGSYEGEQTMANFLLKLNRSNPDISKRLFERGLSDCKSELEIGEFIKDTYKGTTRNELMRKVFEKTPDILSVYINGDWLGLVICDPSTASYVDGRQKQKAASYGIFRHLVSSGSLIDFTLEAPVSNSSATNLESELYKIITYQDPSDMIKNACRSYILRCSNAFNYLRKHSPAVLFEYQVDLTEVNMGCLDSVDYEKYLTDRDAGLIGLTREEISQLFSDKPLSYESEESMKLMEEEIINNINNPTDTPNKACSKRDDIFLSTELKIEKVNEALGVVLSEEPDFEDKAMRPDPIGYFPIPSCFDKDNHSGIDRACNLMEGVEFKGENEYISKLFELLDFERKNIGEDEFNSALCMFRDRNALIKKDVTIEQKRRLDKVNEAMQSMKIVNKNRLRLKGIISDEWRESYEYSKNKSRNKKKTPTPFMKRYNEHSVERIEEMMKELEGAPRNNNDLIGEMVDPNDLIMLNSIVRGRLVDYTKSKGSHAMVNYHRVCYELNILLTQDMSENEIAISNLGTNNLLALVSPGSSISQNESVRHVKFLIRADDLIEGQKFNFKSSNCGKWLIQDGFSKITNKALVHLLNMKMCLTPLYNELSSLEDNEVDIAYKRSYHQLLWMCGDSTTNKLLGVVRYLFLLVFAVICDPFNLIVNELSVNELAWRKDIHIYIIHMINKNLSTTIKQATSLARDYSETDGSLAFKGDFKIKRLLFSGYHRSFTEMLNEFYLYYTWNKLQIDKFNSTKKVFNKLISIRHKCLKKIGSVFDRFKVDRSFGNDEFHLNTGIRRGMSGNRPQYKSDLNYLLKEVNYNQPGVGYAPFLYYSMDKWFKETNAADNLSGRRFQPLEVSLEDLSNTRGSLTRTDMMEEDKPLVSSELKLIAMKESKREEKIKSLQCLLNKGDLILEDFKEQMKETLMEDFEVEEEIEYDDSNRNYLNELGIGMESANSVKKKKIARMLSKRGYDVRSKCMVNCTRELIKVIELRSGSKDVLSDPRVNIDTIIQFFILQKLDMLHGISPKTQHLSDRELRIMDILSKAGVRVVEDLARFLSSVDSRETTTTEKNKQSAQVRNSKAIDKTCRVFNKFGIKLSADKSKWGPGILPTEFIPMLRSIMANMPSLRKVCKLCMFMVIKLQTKRVLVPKELLTNWWVNDLDLDDLSRTQPEVVDFIKSFDPTKRCSFDNVNDMGQGVLNAFSSLKHLAVSTSSNHLYDKVRDQTDENNCGNCLLSSDDSLEMQTFGKENLEESIGKWLITKNVSWRLVNMISNKKKTCGSETLSEYNSNFYLRPVCSPPTIKPIVAAGSLNFDYSWSDTVRAKMSEIKGASENGVSNSTCLLLNVMNKRLYEEIFGINKIKKSIMSIDPANGTEIVARMSSGHVEFGRFPIVDMVKLNIFGNYEMLNQGLNDNRQTEILTNLNDNPFFTLDSEEDIRTDINTLGIKSMHFKLYKISKLESDRRELKGELERLEISDDDMDLVVKNNPFCKNIRSKTIGEQLVSFKDNLESSSMQRAYSNFEGLRGMMRVFGMRYSPNYGSKNSYTEDCSFMMIMILMNLGSYYQLPYEKKFFKDFVGLSEDSNDLLKFKGIIHFSEKKDNYTYPKPISVIHEICKDSLETLKDPCIGNKKPGNTTEPTLMLRPQWNNSYMLSDKPVNCLMGLWSDEIKNIDKSELSINSYDRSVMIERYKFEETLEGTLDSWGLGTEDSYKKASSLCSWLMRLSENSYKRPRLVYGRATTKGGIRKMANDMYCYNEDTDYYIESLFDDPTCPNKWNYSPEEYEFYMTCAAVVPFVGSPNSFKTLFRANLINYNSSLVEQGKNPIILNKNIMKDRSVSEDIRFVIAAISSKDDGKTFDAEETNLIKDCLTAKNHNYLKKQVRKKGAEGEFLDEFEKNSTCVMEYYTSTIRMKIVALRGRFPFVEYYSTVGRMDENFIKENVQDFFLSRAHFSYIEGINMNSEEFLSLKPFRRPNNMQYSFNYDFESKKFGRALTKFGLSVYSSTNKELNLRPRSYESMNFELNWKTKSVNIATVEPMKSINYLKKVMRYRGNTLLSNFSSMASKSVMNSIISSGCFENNLDSLVVFKMLDNVSTIGILENQYSGATVGLLSMAKEKQIIYRDDFESNLDTVTELLTRDVIKGFIKTMDLDEERLVSDFDLDLDSPLEQVSTEAEIDLQDMSTVMKKYNFEASSFEGISFNIVMINEETKEEVKETGDDFNINFFFDTGLASLERQMSTIGRKMWSKWSGIKEMFGSAKDNMELSLLKVISRHSIPRVMKKMDVTIEGLKGCNESKAYLDTMAKVDKLASVAIELSAILMQRPLTAYKRKPHCHYIEYFENNLKRLSDKSNMKFEKLSYINSTGRKQKKKLTKHISEKLKEGYQTHSILADYFGDTDQIIQDYPMVDEEDHGDESDYDSEIDD